jgi:hypothetical protein
MKQKHKPTLTIYEREDRLLKLIADCSLYGYSNDLIQEYNKQLEEVQKEINNIESRKLALMERNRRIKQSFR